MQIDSKQMAIMTRPVRTAGNARIAAYIAQRFPDAFGARDAAQREAIVERLREVAGEHGFVRDDHVGTWADLSIMYGADFATLPWAATVLHDPALDTDAKAIALLRAVRAAGIAV